MSKLFFPMIDAWDVEAGEWSKVSAGGGVIVETVEEALALIIPRERYYLDNAPTDSFKFTHSEARKPNSLRPRGSTREYWSNGNFRIVLTYPN